MHRVEDFLETAEVKATTLYSSWGQSYRYHDIQDLSQELLIVAWLAIGTYDAAKEASVNTWVNRRMDYFIQDFVREEKNKKIQIEYVGDMWDLYEFVEEYQAARRLVFTDSLDEIYALLNDRQKKILQMKLEGYTHEEIAEQMGYSDNSGVAHQWKLIVARILEVKEKEGYSVHPNGNPKATTSNNRNSIRPASDYFKEFWEKLPQNKPKKPPEDIVQQ